ncbi:tetratricopeptide repeat protein [Alteribacillus sp. JSM 102045]|uniref:tetratricopeptide repeat protein n=1 Tax=Alteribacillus sp. JSM 102045 TaxID=1562101 RepID=UPI0035C1E17E
MENLECSIADGKKNITIHPQRMAVYLQSKIVEAVDNNRNVYYLFFFKNEFLAALKAASIRRRSYLEKAFKHGMMFPSTHPFCRTILSSETPFQKRSFNQLHGKLQKQYTPHQTAYILTFFDAFIPKKKLFKDIQTYFYQYRRNGQLFAGYRILWVLLDFTPNHSWVKQTVNDLEYAKFKTMYKEMAVELWEKDPIHMEKALYFKRKKNPEKAEALIDFLINENRWIDAAALLMNQLIRTSGIEKYNRLKQVLETYYPKQDLLVVLEDLYQRSPSLEPLQKDLLHYYLTFQQLNHSISIINEHGFSLNEEQWTAFENMLETVSLDSGNTQVEKLNTYIASLFKTQPDKAEIILQKCVKQLMERHDLSYISKWLIPIKEISSRSLVVKRIEQMKQLSDDPDKQQQLGELYYQFDMLDQAIECFSWEMELDKSDPLPVRWLSKIYLEAGKEEESKAYQQLFRNMQKKANA